VSPVGVRELSLIHAGCVVGRKGVRNQETERTERSLHDKDLGVGAEENVYIGTVCPQRPL
jgi:hypothetical protein